MIYFVKPVNAAGPIKIGYTSYPMKSRLSSLQSCSPVKLEVVATIPKGTEREEQRLHLHFMNDWSHGEWFNPSDELLKTIEYFAAGNECLGIYSDAKDPMDFTFQKLGA